MSREQPTPMPGKGKRKIHQSNERERYNSAKRHKPAHETMGSKWLLSLGQEMALCRATQEDYLRLEGDGEEQFLLFSNAPSGWTSPPLSPHKRPASYGDYTSHCDVIWRSTPKRFGSDEQREYLCLNFPEIRFGSSSSPISPCAPPSPTPDLLPLSHSRASHSEPQHSSLLFDIVFTDEPKELDETQSLPEWAASSLAANSLPFNLHFGTRRALVIGIQYWNQTWNDPKHTSMTLRGTHEDAEDIVRLLLELGYQNEEITLMKDSPDIHPDYIPTHENIKRELTRLVYGALPGDRFFLYFAGHGKQVEDYNGDEADHLDEGKSRIIPCDWSTRYKYSDEGIIIDDYLRDTCVNPLPKLANLTALFDCCHAGTMLDLPYEYCGGPNAINTRIYGSTGAHVLCFAACKDDQKAYALSRGLVTEVGIHIHRFEQILNSKSFPIGIYERHKNASHGSDRVGL
ncbi:Metacaspase-1A [Ceratobasidium theobromae]|uniref:Metacaspase-1A n=1 Tax=Ceratobasidium theobromae TaxID=1582974 RepID=A0A5N5QVE0_9AGAM|nr:Metacaspase-1A [Ceratobasidium theobromae]